MSYNNILPFWFLELDSILRKCEKCLPEEREQVYKEAVKKLKANDSIPEMIQERWISKIETGSLG